MNGENRISKIFAFCFLLIINIFSLVEVKAYYSFDGNQSVSFTTAAYTNLSITTDKTTYGMCNKNAEINLTINNPNNYNINYKLIHSKCPLHHFYKNGITFFITIVNIDIPKDFPPDFL